MQESRNLEMRKVGWLKDSHLVHVCTGGVFMEGPMDRIRGVPVRARKNKFRFANSKKSDPMWISARGLGVCIIHPNNSFFILTNQQPVKFQRRET